MKLLVVLLLAWTGYYLATTWGEPSSGGFGAAAAGVGVVLAALLLLMGLDYLLGGLLGESALIGLLLIVGLIVLAVFLDGDSSQYCKSVGC